MSDLEKEIERLISEKKLAKEAAKKNTEKLFDVDELIASKEKSAALARSEKDIEFIAKIPDSFVSNDSNTEDKNVELQNSSSRFITNVDIIEQLRKAKTAHKKQMARFQILIKTSNFTELGSSNELNYTTCVFGKWFYDKGLMLASFEEYRRLENLHLTVHDYYLQVYNLYKEKIVGTLLSSKKKKITERQQSANKLWLTLKEKSGSFCENILILESKIKDLTKDQMDALNIVKR